VVYSNSIGNVASNGLGQGVGLPVYGSSAPNGAFSNTLVYFSTPANAIPTTANVMYLNLVTPSGIVGSSILNNNASSVVSLKNCPTSSPCYSIVLAASAVQYTSLTSASVANSQLVVCYSSTSAFSQASFQCSVSSTTPSFGYISSSQDAIGTASGLTLPTAVTVPSYTCLSQYIPLAWQLGLTPSGSDFFFAGSIYLTPAPAYFHVQRTLTSTSYTLSGTGPFTYNPTISTVVELPQSFKDNLAGGVLTVNVQMCRSSVPGVQACIDGTTVAPGGASSRSPYTLSTNGAALALCTPTGRKLVTRIRRN